MSLARYHFTQATEILIAVTDAYHVTSSNKY